MLILRRDLSRPLTWNELDHNLEVLEINEWQKQNYEERQKCFVKYDTCTIIYNCIYSHTEEMYEPSDTFNVALGGITVWEAIGSTCGESIPPEDIHVTGMTYNSAESGNTLTVHQSAGYQDVSVFIPSYALYDHYTSAVSLSGTTLYLTRTGGLPQLYVDLQSLVDISTGVTHTDYYVTGATLTPSYVLQLRRNDGVTVSVDLASLRDGNYYTTGATLNGTIVTFTKNYGSPYYLDLSSLVVTGGTGQSGYSGYSGESNISGYSGFSGYSGESNISGYSGYSGAGTSGYSGYSGTGSAGTSGYSGYSGTGSVGTSGYSGYSGAQGLYGGSSLILNGDGDCTTDWLTTGTLFDDPTYWETPGAYGEILTGGTSGFSTRSFKFTVANDFNLPCGAQPTSYRLQAGVTYNLSFQYRGNVDLNVGEYISDYTHQTFSASTGTTIDAQLTFTAQTDNDYLFFGAGTGRTPTYDVDYWIIDKVNLRCGNCTGSTATFTVNNYADNRMLTATDQPDEINAETEFTYTTGFTNQYANQSLVWLLESYHTGNTSGPDFLTNSNSINLITVRGRGTKNRPNAVETGDYIYKQTGYAMWGTGITENDPIEMFSVTALMKSDLDAEDATAKMEYRIKTKSNSVTFDTTNDRLLIDENGDIQIFGGIKVDETVTFSVAPLITESTTGSTYFSYLVDATDKPIIFYLPKASNIKGRIYYVWLKDKTSGSLTITAFSGDTIAITDDTFATTVKGSFVMLQSDGGTNWFPLSIYGTWA